MRFPLSLSFLAAIFVLGTASAAEPCPSPWVCKNLTLKIPYTVLRLRMSAVETIRAGYYPERGAFRGNVLYFEGLGDSMLNHGPLFQALSEAGYRVVAFDYMGQGGSSGRMDRTRIASIPRIGERVWKEFARDTRDFPRKTLLGWSTGGLAAYLAATRSQADRVILLAPGIAPNTIVGGGLTSWPPNLITPESLTTAVPYAASETDPHVDPVRPNSPVKVPAFAVDLITTAQSVKDAKVPASIRGLVLLSGDADTYVDAKKTRSILHASAPHFRVEQYAGALHEIDNERPEIQNRAIADILRFLAE